MLDRLSSSTSDTARELNIKERERVPKVTEVRNDQKAEFQREYQQGLSKEKTNKVISSMNEFLRASNSHLKFEFHEELQEYYVTLIDEETKEVVREIPPKKMLDMYAAMTEYLGLLVDRKV